MKVFISWSGERSEKVGELFAWWIKCVLQAIEPWVSTQDIDKGSLWFSDISTQLKDTSVGIICLTNENKDRPWILFEAGALAKGLSTNRVCTFLIDLTSSEIHPPLSQFNATLPNKDDMRKLVKMLNSTLGTNALKDPILEKVFDTYWPQFQNEFDLIIKTTPDSPKAKKRESDDILSEILDTMRNLERRTRNLESGTSMAFFPDYISRFLGPNSKNVKPPMNEIERLIERLILDGNEDKNIIELIVAAFGIPRDLAQRYVYIAKNNKNNNPEGLSEEN